MLYSVTIEKYQNTQWIAVFFFFNIWLHKTSQCPHAYPPNHCRNQEEGGHEHQNWTAGQQTLMSHNFFYIIWMAGCCAFFTW